LAVGAAPAISYFTVELPGATAAALLFCQAGLGGHPRLLKQSGQHHGFMQPLMQGHVVLLLPRCCYGRERRRKQRRRRRRKQRRRSLFYYDLCCFLGLLFVGLFVCGGSFSGVFVVWGSS
jgi:hypothetical protein